ncbi:MAG: hypothetical protein HC908_14310 [Calothrix sp. SM1_7_51]|nr:hypothetical protein [Calothrix sp. SM1_7_51]
MSVVPTDLKDRIKLHLGYDRPRAVNPASLQQFEAHLNSMVNNYGIYGKKGPTITNLVEKCDKLFRMTDPTDTLVFSQFQQIIGDVNRQTRTVTIDDVVKKNREAYFLACDDLAFQLNIPNLRRPDRAAYTFVNLGSEYVISPPGAADTCLSDRIWLSLNCA